jgi:hypothetical protein
VTQLQRCSFPCVLCHPTAPMVGCLHRMALCTRPAPARVAGVNDMKPEISAEGPTAKIGN